MPENEQDEVAQSPTVSNEPQVPQAPPALPVQPPKQEMKELRLEELEVALIDAALDARQSKMAPIEAEYKRLKAAADARYDETVLKVLAKHGFTKTPQVWSIDLRDQQGNLISPGTFRYVSDNPDVAPPPEKKIKPWEKLKGQKKPR